VGRKEKERGSPRSRKEAQVDRGGRVSGDSVGVQEKRGAGDVGEWHR